MEPSYGNPTLAMPCQANSPGPANGIEPLYRFDSSSSELPTHAVDKQTCNATYALPVFYMPPTAGERLLIVLR